MTRYELAIATADFLEAHPESYRFTNVITPTSPKQRGCVLGHMGRIHGGFGKECVHGTSRSLTGMYEHDFYAAMSREKLEWARSAKMAADALRAVALKHFAGTV